MQKMIFLNLPVKDLPRSVEFFTKLGYTFNPKFTNEDATCMIVSDTIFVMLLVEKFFLTFTKKQICDSAKEVEVLISLSMESRDEVDEMMAKAAAAGATIATEANFYMNSESMYTGSYLDLDGHHWELIWMSPEAAG
ncbi:MAG: VOC family protein [bacterium]